MYLVRGSELGGKSNRSALRYSCSQPDLQMADRAFLIHYFARYVTSFRIHVKRPRVYSLCYGDLLTAVGKHLKLKPRSLEIFGLFWGPLGRPTKLCGTNENIPEDIETLCFQKLSFDQEDETTIIKNDEKALELVFWEIRKCKLNFKLHEESENGGIKQTKILVRKLNSALAKKHNVTSIIMDFMQVILGLQYYYWLSFYQVKYCHMEARLVVSNVTIYERQKIHVFLDKTAIFCYLVHSLDGTIEQFSMPWSSIYSVKKNTSENLFLINVLIQDGSRKREIKTVIFRTKYYDYLYSISMHILGIQKKILSQIDFKQPHDLTVEEIQALDSVRPPFLENLANFVSMFLPIHFHQFFNDPTGSSEASSAPLLTSEELNISLSKLTIEEGEEEFKNSQFNGNITLFIPNLQPPAETKGDSQDRSQEVGEESIERELVEGESSKRESLEGESNEDERELVEGESSERESLEGESNEGESVEEVSTESESVTELFDEAQEGSESKESILVKSQESITIESLEENIQAKVQKCVEVESQENIQAKSQGSIQANSQESIQAKSGENIQAESQETIQAKSQESIQAKSGESIQAEPEETIQAKSQESIQAKSEESIQAEPEETIQAKSKESIQAKSGESIQAESQETIQANLSKESIQAESLETIQTESLPTVSELDNLVAAHEYEDLEYVEDDDNDSQLLSTSSHRLFLVTSTHGLVVPPNFFNRMITIHSFLKTIDISVPYTTVTVAELKTKYLHLKQKSSKIFGLFLGPLTCPTRLLLEHEVLTNNISEFCLRRLSFDKSIEKMVTRSDVEAVDFLYREARYMFENDLIFPEPSSRNRHYLNSLIEGRNKALFMKQMYDLPLFWWSYYYRVNYCLHESEGIRVMVIVNKDHLIIKDSNGEDMSTYSWDTVQLMLKLDNTIKFEILEYSGIGDRYHFDIISVETDSSEFLYSIIAYIFQQLEASEGQVSERIITSRAKSHTASTSESKPHTAGTFEEKSCMVGTWSSQEMSHTDSTREGPRVTPKRSVYVEEFQCIMNKTFNGPITSPRPTKN